MKFKFNLIVFIFTLLSVFPVFAGKIGSGDSKQDYNVAVCDQKSGYTAGVDSSGNLKVAVSGGINGSFTASNVAVTSLVPGTSATSNGKAEDAPESDGMTVVAVGTVRRDTAASSAGTTGDVATLNTDASGNLWTVNASMFAEDVAHTTADKGVGILAVRDDAPISAKTGTDGDYGNLSIDDVGNLYVRPNSSYAEDSAHVSADYGAPCLVVRKDTAASLAGTDGDYTILQTDATGYLRTTSKSTYAEDAANTSGDTGIHILGVRTDTLATSAGTTGDYAEVNLSAEGAIYTAGNKAEDDATASGDYLNPIGVRRIDAAIASSAGSSGDYANLDTDAQGAVYVNNRRAATLIQTISGDAVGGLTIRTAAGSSLKSRIYKITVSSAAAEVITITELANCNKIYTQAGGQTVYDFGFNGKLQTTANTAITATSADASACQIIVEYSTE